MSRGEWAAAASALSFLIYASPTALGHARRAEALLNMRRPRAAISDCEAAHTLSPSCAKALKVHARALLRLGQVAEALCKVCHSSKSFLPSCVPVLF